MRWRISAIIVLALLCALGLSSRLFYMSVFKHASYVSAAKEQQNIVMDITPKRGEIYAQDYSAKRSSLVAQSVEVYSLSATPYFVERKAAYANLLAQVSGKAKAEVLDILNSDSMYMNPLKVGLTKDDVESIALKICALERQYTPSQPDVPVNFDAVQGNIIYYLGGVFFIRGYQRVYPEGPMLGQLLGFVNDKGEGQYGFEGQYDKQLQGYAGQIRLERDSSGTLLSQSDSVAWQNGSSYALTIDRNIQFMAEQELASQVKDAEATGGSVVIMDPKTGAILALANTPSFDPNNFRDIAKDQFSLFDDPVVSSLWEPGSIMKPLIMAGAIDQGVVTPDTKNTFPESVTVDGHVINTALRKAYGEETMTQVLVNSDNVAMVWVANKLGNQNMYNYLNAYGFGSQTGVDLKDEIAGSLLPLNQWRDINRATMAFGQGIAITPMQMLTAYSAIANGGREVQPHVVKAVINPDGTQSAVTTVTRPQIIKPETAAQVRDMMVATVLQSHARAGVVGYKIAGKTGTAQVPDPTNGGYIDNAYNHSFIGFGPSDDPKYLMLVKIDRPNIAKVGMFAESTTVPLFGRLSQFLLNYFQIAPTNR